ncbi:MAG TPA: hypothetical protein VK866_05570 [Acidimicrobiales bacterium]|nr:hypothetical protein [Acidimicrobiales bacterium]
MDFKKLTLGDQILGGTSLAVFLVLLIFPWHSVDFGLGSFDIGATESPNGFWGLLGILLALVLLASVIVKMTTAKVPDLPIPMGDAQFYGAIAMLAVLVLKLVLETESLAIGAYLAILLSGGAVYGGFLLKGQGAAAGSTPPQAF